MGPHRTHIRGTVCAVVGARRDATLPGKSPSVRELESASVLYGAVPGDEKRSGLTSFLSSCMEGRIFLLKRDEIVLCILTLWVCLTWASFQRRFLQVPLNATSHPSKLAQDGRVSII